MTDSKQKCLNRIVGDTGIEVKNSVLKQAKMVSICQKITSETPQIDQQ